MELLKHPPKGADRLLEWLCREELQEEIQGDLHQYYAQLLRAQDPWVGFKYWYHTLQFLRPFALKPIVKNSNTLSMIRLNFVVAFRSLMNNKFYAFINILGLALGLAVCMLIGTYIKHELSYDRHWSKSDRIFRAVGELKFQDNHFNMSVSPEPMAFSFLEDFPRIVKAGRFRNLGGRLVQVGERFYQETHVAYADPEVLEIFDFELLYGAFEGALADPAGAMISASSAKRLFGNSDPIGKRFDHEGTPYAVKAVYADIPENTHFDFTMLLSMESYNDPGANIWLSNNYRTYFLLDSPDNYEAVSESFSSVYEKYFGPQIQSMAGASWEEFTESGSFVNYYLQPVSSIHLHSDLQYEIRQNGNMQYIVIFGAAGLFVLIIAAINFMNLSTARSSARAKEVGIKKVVGSPKFLLINQFLSESVLNSVLALALAIGLLHLGLPTLNELTGKSISNPLFGELNLFPAVIFSTIIVGLLAGIYPAFFLAGFSPLKVLKGELSRGIKGGTLRNVLVTVQFIASVVLIFGTIVIHRQLAYTQNKDLGFNQDQVLIVDDVFLLGEKAESFRNELLTHPAIQKATLTRSLPSNQSRSDSPLLPKESTDMEGAVAMQLWGVDEYYIPTLEMELVMGRNFDPLLASDSAGVILNESAVSRFGFPLDSAVGRSLKTIHQFPIFGMTEFKVVGVVKDFHFDNFKRSIEPVALFYTKPTNIVSLRFDAGRTQEVLAFVEQKWAEFNNTSPFHFEFMDQQFAARFTAEQKLSKLSTVFAVLAIFIACLGLFGLAAYSGDQRKKEIGVRKVLGASVEHLIEKQISSYMRWLLVALVIALPVGYWLMSSWLADFEYATTIPWFVYLAPALLILIFAGLTVGSVSYRIARENPVNNLHSE